MKKLSLLLVATALATVPTLAQVTVIEPRVVVAEPPVTVPAPLPGGVAVVPPGGSVTVRTFDPTVVRRQLSIAPRAVVVDPQAPTPPPVPPPGNTTVQKTVTTTVVDTPGMPRRVYNEERQVVVVNDQDQVRELPYVTVPVLFVKSTAELLDAQSAAALEQMASVVMEIAKTEPTAVFDVEGHTSTEGTTETNMGLSVARAQRVHAELTQRYGVPASMLTAHGYGETFPAYPNGAEDQLQLDRRVLIVRTR